MSIFGAAKTYINLNLSHHITYCWNNLVPFISCLIRLHLICWPPHHVRSVVFFSFRLFLSHFFLSSQNMFTHCQIELTYMCVFFWLVYSDSKNVTKIPEKKNWTHNVLVLANRIMLREWAGLTSSNEIIKEITAEMMTHSSNWKVTHQVTTKQTRFCVFWTNSGMVNFFLFFGLLSFRSMKVV